MHQLSHDIHHIHSKIYAFRGVNVILDRDLADLYQVETKLLKRQVNRNRDRFPSDFMFELSKAEYDFLRCQFGTLKQGSHSKYLPYAFTEQGVAMLSSVLKGKVAVQVNIRIMRVFVEIRHVVSEKPEYISLKQTIKQIESRMEAVEANHLIDNIAISGKVTQLSKDVYAIRNLFDQFQDAHIIIKKPTDDINQG